MKTITGKDLLLAALRHETVSNVPWVPFAGVHAGKLAGYSARQVLTDRQMLADSLLAVNRLYDPDGQPVLFDLQVEAEILGCTLKWAENTPPSVVTHPLAVHPAIPTYLPEASDGRLPIVLDVMRMMKQTVGDHTALYGLVCGPLTLASHLRGTDIFMDFVDRPDFVHSLLDYCTQVSLRMAALYCEAGMDVIAVVDPLVSQIAPRHFKNLLSQSFTRIFTDIHAMDALSSFFVCGDATKNIEVMCQTGPDCIAVDENINLPLAKQITDRYDVTISGNIPLTTCMLLGNQQDNMKYVVDLLAEVEPHNFILSPGCDMPYDTPVENVIGVLQAVRNPAATRAMVANYHTAESTLEVDLPDYEHLQHPLIEVFTLDSDTCAACAYMLHAAQDAVRQSPEPVDLVEYKFTRPENVARVKKMGVKNLPSIYINGELKFSSIIPSQQELLAAMVESRKEPV